MHQEPRPRGRPRTRIDYRQVHIYLPSELIATIDEMVQRKGISRNTAIVQMLTKATKTRAKKEAK